MNPNNILSDFAQHQQRNQQLTDARKGQVRNNVYAHDYVHPDLGAPLSVEPWNMYGERGMLHTYRGPVYKFHELSPAEREALYGNGR